MSFVTPSNNTLSPVDKVQVQYPSRQIRGIAPSGALGVGIPRHVSNVRAAASTNGQTTLISVTFSRDPSDPNFDHVQVLAKGLNGSNNYTVVTSGKDSPLSFTLPNSSQQAVVVVQAIGNSGAAPLATAPSTSIKVAAGAFGGSGTLTPVAPTSITQLTGVVPSDCLPRPTTARFAMWQASTTSGTWLATNDTFTSSTGPGGGSSSIAPTASSGQATQGTNNVNWQGSAWIWPRHTITFLTTANITVTATSQIYWGMTSAGGGAVPTTADFIGIGVSSAGATAGNWLLLTSTGGAISSIDSLVAITQGVRHTLKITVASGVATLYLDGVSIATNATLPSANPLSLSVVGKNAGGTGLAFTTEYAYAEASST